MEGINIEKLEKEIKEGKDFLMSISHIHPMQVKRILEDIYEMYSNHFSEFLQDEYKSHRVFDIIYDKDGNISSASLKWNYWDSGEINIKCTGIEVVYKPEHGPQKTIAKLHWKFIKPYFNEILK